MRKIALFALLFVSLSAAAADLPSFMTGSWRDDAGGEEHWTSAKGSLMTGMHRDVHANGGVSFEFLRIEKTKDGSLVYLAMPSGHPATPFPLKSITDTKVVFENPQHDFPQRIIYWREGAKLCARVEGTMNGKAAGEEWCWVRFAL